MSRDRALSSTMAEMAKRTYGTGHVFTKHNAWYGEWRQDGRRIGRKIGPVKKGRDGLSKTQAEEKLREMMLVEASRPTTGDAATVEQLGEILLARLERAGRKRSHIESVGYHLSKHIVPHMGDLEAPNVLPADVEKLVNKMHRLGLSPKTVRNVAGTLHSVLGQVVKDNPCDMATLPRVPKSGVLRFLTQAELERVLTTPLGTDDEIRATFPVGLKYGGPQAVRDWWPVVRLSILTASMTGMRLGELRALQWDHLDFGAMKVRVRFSNVRGQTGTPKSEFSIRAVPLASRLIAELEQHHRSTVWNQDGDLVLAHPHTGAALDRVRLGTHYKAALRRADVRPVRFHDLRHTFATTVAASGEVSLRTLQEWMGHEDIRTTQIYAAYMPSGREQQMLDAAFDRAAGDPVEAPTS